LRVDACTGRRQAPNRLVLVCVSDNYLGKLHEAVTAVMGSRQVVLELATREQGELFPGLVPKRADRRTVAVGSPLSPRYTFETFVVGASNQFAQAAARAVATQPGDHYNPLFIYGGVGLGKTHLVSAIAHALLDQDPTRRIANLSADAFMNELISSLRRDRMESFKHRFREVDVLVLDDVQLLAGRERTQEEFFHTFNALYERRKDHPDVGPGAEGHPRLEERLRNRFEWGYRRHPALTSRPASPSSSGRPSRVDSVACRRRALPGRASRRTCASRGVLTWLSAHASLSGQPITVTTRASHPTSVRPPGARHLRHDRRCRERLPSGRSTCAPDAAASIVAQPPNAMYPAGDS
jgi:chromosomal replication initiator protein